MKGDYLTMEDYKRLHPPREVVPSPRELAEQRLRKYDVIIQHFNQIVDWMENGMVPVDERHSELRVFCASH